MSLYLSIPFQMVMVEWQDCGILPFWQNNEENKYLSETVRRLLEVMEYDVPYTSSTLMGKLGLKAKC